MRNNALFNSFTDLSDRSWPTPPHVVVLADDIAKRRFLMTSDDYDGSIVRPVIYENASAQKFYLELVPYVHPTGAGNLTIGTVATSGTGVVTYTPSQEGRLLGEDGALINTSSPAIDIAGLLFTDYFTHFSDNADQRENFRVVTIHEGDFLWLIRKGVVYLDSTGALTSGDDLMVSASVAGEVDKSTTVDTTSAASLNTTLTKHLTGDAYPASGACVGRCLETIGAAGLVKAELLLPARLYR